MNKQSLSQSKYTKDLAISGAEPAVSGKGKGWALSHVPVEEMLSDPSKAPAIKAILKDLHEKTGLDLDLHLPLIRLFDKKDVYTLNGRPVIYLKYTEKKRTKGGVSFNEPQETVFVYLDTMEIMSVPGGDPATLQHNAVVEQAQQKSAEGINAYFQYEFNKVVDYVCSNSQPPLQNVRAMLLKARRIIETRISILEDQVMALSKPVEIPESLSETLSKTKSEMGIVETNSEKTRVDLSYDESLPDKLANTIANNLTNIIIMYWDKPEAIINMNKESLAKVISNSQGVKEEEVLGICDKLIELMQIVKNDWDEAREKRKIYESGRSTPDPSKERPSIDWALRKVKPIAIDQAQKIVKKRSLVPQGFRGESSIRRQGPAAIKSITETELIPLNQTLANILSATNTLKQISMRLKSSGKNMSASNLDNNQKMELRKIASTLQRFTEVLKHPLINESGKIDKRQMGYGASSIANMEVSSYLGLCQHVLQKIACEGAADDMQMICSQYNKPVEIG